MAILKNFKGTQHKVYQTFHGTTSTNYYDGSNERIFNLSEKNFALLEDSNASVMHFGNSTNDSVNMSPYFNKSLSFESEFKANVRHGFSNNMLYTGKPKINARFDYLSSNARDEELLSSQLLNNTFKNNADLVSAYNTGNYAQFTIDSDIYTLFVLQTQNNSKAIQDATYSSAPRSKILLVKGSDFSNSDFIIKSDLVYFGNYNLISVNTAQKIIYLSTTIDSQTNISSGAYADTYPTDLLVALSFKVISQDNVFEFSNEKTLLSETSKINEYFSEGSVVSSIYMGQDSADNDCFMFIENIKDYSTVTNTASFSIIFAKINFTTFASASSSTALTPGSKFSLLNCFDIHSVSFNASTAASDYSNQHNPSPSKFINFDSNFPNNFVAYLPLFKNNGNLSPLCIQWDKAENVWTNAFVITDNLLSNVSVNGAANGVTVASIGNPRQILTSANARNNAGTYVSYMSSFVTSSNSLHFLFNYKDLGLYNTIISGSSLLNTCLSFSIDTNDPTNLGYENILTVSSLDSILLKDYTNNTYNELAVIGPQQIQFYSYSIPNGWVLSHQVSGLFSEFTLDSFSRRWALENQLLAQAAELVNINNHYIYTEYDIKLHLISQVLPYSTSVAFDQTNVVYSGSNINLNLIVNAYDDAGNRLAVDVLLVIEGNNMEFGDGSTSSTVTTSANANKNVPVTITGPGYINVSASFDV